MDLAPASPVKPSSPGTVGMEGDWNLPLATTTRSKVSVVPECSTSHPPSVRLRSRPACRIGCATEAEGFGIAMQVGEDRAIRWEDRITFGLEVAEGGHNSTGIGVHCRPHAAVAVDPRPLTAEHRTRSKIVGSNPCDTSHRAATSPPGPAPITATLPVIPRTVAYTSIRLNDMPETSYVSCGDLSLVYQVQP